MAISSVIKIKIQIQIGTLINKKLIKLFLNTLKVP